jgi:hypothetical protein
MANSRDGITVTKLDAAQRQLRTALRLWFQDGDPVSIHALLAAAHEIIHRLYRNKGLRNLMFDSEHIEEGHRGNFAKKIKEAPNFFKHADRDSADSITFYPDVNNVFPMFLIQGLRDMGEQLGMEERAFIYWVCIHEPDLFNTMSSALPINLIEQLTGIDKEDFFEGCKELWRQGALRDVLQGRAAS